jgi:hypothetical protein
MVVTFCKERTEPGLQADWRLNQRYLVEEISGRDSFREKAASAGSEALRHSFCAALRPPNSRHRKRSLNDKKA